MVRQDSHAATEGHRTLLYPRRSSPQPTKSQRADTQNSITIEGLTQKDVSKCCATFFDSVCEPVETMKLDFANYSTVPLPERRSHTLRIKLRSCRFGCARLVTGRCAKLLQTLKSSSSCQYHCLLHRRPDFLPESNFGSPHRQANY